MALLGFRRLELRRLLNTSHFPFEYDYTSDFKKHLYNMTV